MKLENFPTNPTAIEMMKMVTGNGFYDQSYIAKWIFQVMGQELHETKGIFDDLRLQRFPETTTWALPYHEEKYGLSSYGLSLDERRERVMMVRTMRPPMNPARLGKFISEYSGRPVDVQELLKTYCFKVFVNFDFDTSSTVLDGIFDKINQLKPAHLSYDVTARVTPAVLENKNKYKLHELDFHTFFQNYGNVILLDGKKLLDGSWRLDQRLRRFNFFQLHMGDYPFKNNFQFSHQMDYRYIWNHPNQFKVQKFGLIVSAYNLGEAVLFNGKQVFDGSWHFNQVFEKGMVFQNLAFKGITFKHHYNFNEKINLKYSAVVKNQNHGCLDTIHFETSFYNTGNPVLLNGKYRIDKSWRLNQRRNKGFHFQKFAMQISVKNENKFESGYLVKDNRYYLDGSVDLDGSRNLDAEIIKEDI